MTRRTRPPGKPASPRPPARPIQPAPPRHAEHDDRAPASAARTPSYVIVLWQAPELRQRNPGLPLSLHEALQLGRHPEPDPSADREAEP